MHYCPHVLITLKTESSSTRKFLRGVCDYARHFGAWSFLWEPGDSLDVSAFLERNSVDAFITMDLPEYRDLLAQELPAVTILHDKARKPNAITIDTDDAGVAAVAAEHFLQRGYQHFAYFGRHSGLWSLQREVAFVAAINAAGHEVAVLRAEFSYSAKGDARFDAVQVVKWLQMLPKPIAIFAANDHFARHLVDCCRRASIRVPAACSILGVGLDQYLCELTNPPLSSVALDFQHAGYLAAQALDQQMRQRRAEYLRITAQAGPVVLRRSTDALAVGDPVLARALQYLQERAHRAVAVHDLAVHVGLSRRRLEQRFRFAMGTSPLQHHRAVRAAHIARVLLETKLPLEAISEQCGFSEAGNLTRFFKSIKGESPSAYRKRRMGTS